MGMSVNEARAYQALLNAIEDAAKKTDPKHLSDPKLAHDLAYEYLDFHTDVAKAAERLVAVVISERVNRDTGPAYGISLEDVQPYLF